ncbi:hypothetical protein HDV62DRAFT_270203 [Trichoderma sp. SZMC 28011]
MEVGGGARGGTSGYSQLSAVRVQARYRYAPKLASPAPPLARRCLAACRGSRLWLPESHAWPRGLIAPSTSTELTPPALPCHFDFALRTHTRLGRMNCLRSACDMPELRGVHLDATPYISMDALLSALQIYRPRRCISTCLVSLRRTRVPAIQLTKSAKMTKDRLPAHPIPSHHHQLHTLAPPSFALGITRCHQMRWRIVLEHVPSDQVSHGQPSPVQPGQVSTPPASSAQLKGKKKKREKQKARSKKQRNKDSALKAALQKHRPKWPPCARGKREKRKKCLSRGTAREENQAHPTPCPANSRTGYKCLWRLVPLLDCH